MKFRSANTFKDVLLNLVLVIATAFLLLFIFFNAVLPYTTHQGQTVSVPDLRGKSFQEIVPVLKKCRLRYEVTDSLYDASAKPEAVIEQFPKANAVVKINRTIRLSLNATHPPMVTYPDLKDASLSWAQARLKILGIRVGSITYRPDIADNVILESRTHEALLRTGDRVPKGTVVDLVIGKYTNRFPLPDFSGMSFHDVEQFILSMNLKIAETNNITEVGEEINVVQRQEPAAGDTVKQGDAIRLWVFNFKNTSSHD